jgi:hypothetical protein
MQVKYEPWVLKTEDNEVWGVKILDGEFAGCAFAINELDEKEGSKELILDYNVVQPPENKSVEDASGPNFEAALNFIIQDILQKAINAYENREGNPTEPGE